MPFKQPEKDLKDVHLIFSRTDDIQEIPFKAGSWDNKPSFKTVDGSESSVARPGMSGKWREIFFYLFRILKSVVYGYTVHLCFLRISARGYLGS